MENTEKINNYLENILEHFSYSKSLLANNMNLNYQTLMSRLKENRISGIDLVMMAKIFNFNKQQLKNNELPQKHKDGLQTVSLYENEQYPHYEEVFINRIEWLIKNAKDTKKELAIHLGYSYSQIINRFTNASFTATDLIIIMDRYDVDFNSLISVRPNYPIVEECDYENEDLIDFSKIDIEKRPNLGILEMKNYVDGGFTVENMSANGYHLYIPYGISVDLINSLEDSIRAIEMQIGMTKTSIQSIKSQLDNLPENDFNSRQSLEYLIEIQEQAIVKQKNTIPILNMLANSISKV